MVWACAYVIALVTCSLLNYVSDQVTTVKFEENFNQVTTIRKLHYYQVKLEHFKSSSKDFNQVTSIKSTLHSSRWLEVGLVVWACVYVIALVFVHVLAFKIKSLQSSSKKTTKTTIKLLQSSHYNQVNSKTLLLSSQILYYNTKINFADFNLIML